MHVSTLGHGSHAGPGRGRSATPATRGLPYSDVTFATSDGVRLSAWYLRSTNHAAVVAVPGSGSSRTGTLDQAAVLARHGYGVLMVDPRGQGRSDGHAMDAGWYGDRDISAAVAFLQRQAGVNPDRIGVLGLSMGGEEAIGAAAAEPAIRAVVAEGATHRTAADKAGYLPGGITGTIQRGMDRLTYGVASLLTSAPEPRTLRSAITSAPGTPFLLIAGDMAVDEPEAVAHLRAAAPDRVDTWTVPDGQHTRALAAAPAEWTARVTAFLDRTLLTADSRLARRPNWRTPATMSTSRRDLRPYPRLRSAGGTKMEWRKPAEMTARRPMTSDGDPALRIGPERIAHCPVVVVH